MAKPKLLHIVPASEKLRQEAVEVLAAAMDADYESVIIFGFKDGGFYQHWSRSTSNVEKIGFIEEAKYTLLKRDDYD